MKKTLLIAAAALVAATITSEAQVYSANIVGYVNHVSVAGQVDLIANPLTTGNDVLTNVLTGVPGASSIQYWNGAGWVSASYSSKSGHWTSGAGNEDNRMFPPGVGFFYLATVNSTNTFVGSVIVPSGQYGTNSLPGGNNAPVGELVPFSDVLTNTATVNLVLGGASSLQTWTVSPPGFTPYSYSSKSGNWTASGGLINPTINPAQGFFVLATGANTNWVQKCP